MEPDAAEEKAEDAEAVDDQPDAGMDVGRCEGVECDPRVAGASGLRNSIAQILADNVENGELPAAL